MSMSVIYITYHTVRDCLVCMFTRIDVLIYYCVYFSVNVLKVLTDETVCLSCQLVGVFPLCQNVETRKSMY